MSIERDPFGREYRTGRLTDAQTAQRMLSTAVDKVNREGLRVSFDLLRFEDLITEAGVARSAAYRRWPTKNHFYADLLVELARHQHPAIAANNATDENTTSLGLRLIGENIEKLATPAGRRGLLVEIARVGALHNFVAITQSRAWSVYVTLTATLTSLPDTPLQSELQSALEEAERSYLQRMSQFYESLLHLLGFRLRRDLPDVTHATLALLGGTAIEGLALNDTSMPHVGSTRFTADPFLTGDEAEWSLPALSFTSVYLTLVEPDDERPGDWTAEQLAECRRLLDER